MLVIARMNHFSSKCFSIHELLSYLQETQMELEASPTNHVL